MSKSLRLGVDLVQISRIARLVERYGIDALRRMLTEDELADVFSVPVRLGNNQPLYRRIATKVAAKEAVAKALGVGLNGLGYVEGIAWKDVALTPESDTSRRPVLTLDGAAEMFQKALKIKYWTISLSHDGDYVVCAVAGS
jgi:holo-[acyl-carrier protein] synthase